MLCSRHNGHFTENIILYFVLLQMFELVTLGYTREQTPTQVYSHKSQRPRLYSTTSFLKVTVHYSVLQRLYTGVI
jgi:hypothetical protein